MDLALLGVAYFAWRSVSGPFGLALAMTALVVGLASAIGLALVFLTAMLFVVDELGERRAEVYTAELKSRK